MALGLIYSGFGAASAVLPILAERLISLEGWRFGFQGLSFVVWGAFFFLMAARGGADGRHTGDSLVFWEEACDNDLRKGCATLALYEFLYCRDGSGWACNELGAHYVEGAIVEPDPEVSSVLFGQACQQAINRQGLTYDTSGKG